MSELQFKSDCLEILNQKNSDGAGSNKAVTQKLDWNGQRHVTAQVLRLVLVTVGASGTRSVLFPSIGESSPS